MSEQTDSGRSSQASVDALRASDPTLARMIDSLEPVDLATWRARWSLDPFSSLARAIVGQQIATRAAAAIFGRLQTFIGDRDPASAIAAASDAELRQIGLSGNKAASLRDLAAKTLDGRLQLDRLDDLMDEEAHEQLTAVRGIGSWTADMFLLGQLGRPDISPRVTWGSGVRSSRPTASRRCRVKARFGESARRGARIGPWRPPTSTARSAH